MTGYFFIGFIGGIALSFIMVAGLIYKLKSESQLAKKTIDRLERYNTLLQRRLQVSDRQLKEVSGEPSSLLSIAEPD